MVGGRQTLAAALVAAVSLAALGAAVLLGNSGLAPVWLWLLLVVPLTAGLPTTLAVLIVLTLWNGPPLWAFALSAAAAGFILQLIAHLAVTRLLRRREARA